jgi:hypothetical protein
MFPEPNPTFGMAHSKFTPDITLFYYESPIFCLGKTARDRYYLAYAYEPENDAWIVAYVTCRDLLDMFNNVKPMDEILQNSTEKYIGCGGCDLKRVSSFAESEMPKKKHTYGRIGDLEIKIMERIKAELLNPAPRMTKHELLEALKDLGDEDIVQVAVNFSCDLENLQGSTYKDTFECTRITGVDVDTFDGQKVADLNIEVKVV